MTASDFAKAVFLDSLTSMTRELYPEEEWKLYQDLSTFLKRYQIDSSGFIPLEYKIDAEKAKMGA
jgi:hypothetical protein